MKSSRLLLSVLVTIGVLAGMLIAVSAAATAQTATGEVVLTVKYAVQLAPVGTSWSLGYKPDEPMTPRKSVVQLPDGTNTGIRLATYYNWHISKNTCPLENPDYPDMAWPVYSNLQPATMYIDNVRFIKPSWVWHSEEYYYENRDAGPPLQTGLNIRWETTKFGSWYIDPDSIRPAEPGLDEIEREAIRRLGGSNWKADGLTISPTRAIWAPQIINGHQGLGTAYMQFDQTYTCSELFDPIE
ncbi:MAG: hypothetical protein ACR2N2_11395 [Acidimicrobiia bacterium]